MNQTRAKPPTKQIHVRPQTYRELRQLMVDRDASWLTEVTEEVIEAGLEAIRSRRVRASTN